MLAAEYEDDQGGSASSFSRWVIPALILSLGLHVYFVMWARDFKITSTQSEEYFERKALRPFHIERAEIDEKLLEPEPADDKRQAMAPEAVKLPDEKVAFETLKADLKGAPAAPKIDHSFLSDKPSANTTTYETAAQLAERSGAKSFLEDPKSLQNAILAEKPDAGGQTLGKALDPEALSGRVIVRDGQLRGGDTPGFSNLDDLLANTGPLTAETAVRMNSDLLFEYGEYHLSLAALTNLTKLGKLIQQNPDATFIIEGHTDSFGSDESNQDLSIKRAEMVKMWLVQEKKISQERILTKGFGETRLIAPSSGTKEEQKINRRVEIVIRPKK